MAIWTGEEVISRLGVSPEMVTRWRKTGVLRVKGKIGTANIYEPDDVNLLIDARDRPVSDTDVPKAWVVRLSDPGEDADGRRTGWRQHEGEAHEEAASRWWRIANPEEQVGKALVAVVGDLVVGVWRIEGGITDPESGKAAFELGEASPEQRAAYFHRWLSLGRGTGLQRWPLPRAN